MGAFRRGGARERVVPTLPLLDQEANLDGELVYVVSFSGVILPIIECTYQVEVELVNLLRPWK